MFFAHQCRVVWRLALPAATLIACARETPPVRSTFADDFGDTLAAGAIPARIVSLNPATTEIIYAVGAGSRLVGRTAYDAYPPRVRAVADLGPGLRPNVEAIIATRPDLVILYAGEDNRDAARRLRATGIRTASFRVDRIRDLSRVTRLVGQLTGDTVEAARTIDSVNATLARVRTATASLPHPSVFWPFWESPLLSVGGGSFVNEMIEMAGGRNVFAELPQPSPQVTFEELVRRDPDLILTGPTTRQHMLSDPRWGTLRAVREGKILVIDTTIVNGPSPRVGANTAGLAKLLHPEAKL